MVDMPENITKPNPIYFIYMYKEDLALNNLQWLKIIKPNQTKPNQTKPNWILPLRAEVELGVMTLKSYSILPKSPEFVRHHQMHVGATPMTYPFFF